MNFKREEVFFVSIKLIIQRLDLFFDIFMNTTAILNKLQKIKDIASREYETSSIIISKLTAEKAAAEARAEKAEAKLRVLVELGLYTDEDSDTEVIDQNGAMPHFCFKGECV